MDLYAFERKYNNPFNIFESIYELKEILNPYNDIDDDNDNYDDNYDEEEDVDSIS